MVTKIINATHLGMSVIINCFVCLSITCDTNVY